MKKKLKLLVLKLSNKVISFAEQYREFEKRRQFNIKPSVSVYGVSLEGNISIDEYSYINPGSRIDTGPFSKIIIGKHCAIGRFVHITSKSHNFEHPTTSQKNIKIKHDEANINIGDEVWIGDHVFIKPGVRIGNYSIIGANSVVTKEVKPFEIIGGVPAKHIRYNTKHYLFKK